MGALVSEYQREKIVRDAFRALADEFIDRVDSSESGNLVIHYQNGIPLKRNYDFGGRIQLRSMGPTQGVD